MAEMDAMIAESEVRVKKCIFKAVETKMVLVFVCMLEVFNNVVKGILMML